MRTRQSFKTMVYFAGTKIPVEVLAVYDEPEESEDPNEIVFICPELTVFYEGMVINDFMFEEDFTYIQQAIDSKLRHADAERAAQKAAQKQTSFDE